MYLHRALDLTGLGFLFQSFSALANISDALLLPAEGAAWRAEADTLVSTINARFLHPASGVYSGSGWNATQCGQAMPLFMRLVPPNATSAALRVLVDNVIAHGSRLAVGAFGVKWLLMTLSDMGEADLAFAIMNSTQYPGFGYMLNGSVNGVSNATTVWESWFTSDDTYSQNHPMFTSGEVGGF